jgi:hypothetical protein
MFYYGRLGTMDKLVFAQHEYPDSVTAHQLAQMLLAGPDYKVVSLSCRDDNTEPEPCIGVRETPAQLGEPRLVVVVTRPLSEDD